MREIYSRRLLASMYMQQARMLQKDGQRKAARGLLVKAMAILVQPAAPPQPELIPVRAHRR